MGDGGSTLSYESFALDNDEESPVAYRTGGVADFLKEVVDAASKQLKDNPVAAASPVEAAKAVAKGVKDASAKEITKGIGIPTWVWVVGLYLLVKGKL